MFRKKSDDELWRLQQELLAAEEEDEYEEEVEEEDLDEDLFEEYEDDEDGEDSFDEDEDFDEEEEEEPVYRNYANRYGRGSPKRFDDDDFFDEDDFADEDVLYRRDYKKAKRKKRRRNFGLAILAMAELWAIGAIILWFLSWIK